ncbi:MAG: tetratricopeptide repeat protein [Aureispira sp.]
MKINRYAWSIYFLFIILGVANAQNEVIELQEARIYIPQDEESLKTYVEEAKKNKRYTYCGDFYRRFRSERDPRRRAELDRQAVKFYKKAIKKGEVAAYHRMAYMYYKGRGVKPDDRKCLEALEQASRNSYAPADHNLGMLYLLGKSRLVLKDADKAETYFINIGRIYSKVTSASSNDIYTKSAVEWLVQMYTKPYYSKEGKKMNLKDAMIWSKRLEDQSILHELYDELSDYEILVSKTTVYPHLIPGLSLKITHQSLEVVDSVFKQIKHYLPMLGEERLKHLKISLFEQYLKTKEDTITQESACVFLKEMKAYLHGNYAAGSPIHTKCIDKIKEIEMQLAQKYTLVTIVPYLKYAHERIIHYPQMTAGDYEALQKITLGSINIINLTEKTLKDILPLLAQSTWRQSTLREQMIEKGEERLWDKENDNSVTVYLQSVYARWKKYSPFHQQQSFDMVLRRSISKWKAKKTIEASADVRLLIPVPEKGIRNAQRLQAEVLGLIDIAKKLGLNYKFSVVEETLLTAQGNLCFEAYKRNFTVKTDLNCTADEKHYVLKKAYYRALLSRIRSDYKYPNQKEMANFLGKIFWIERFSISSKGNGHSYKNLWIFIQEFMLQLTPTEQKWIQALMGSSFQKKLCQMMNESGKIRFYALIRENAQFSIKWHAEHTSPNCLPTWSSAVKQSCSFCTLYEKENPHLSDKYYESHSALAYAEEIIGDESLIKLLQTLGAKEEPRDLARKAQQEVERQEQEEKRLAEQREREAHGRFIKTIKTGDCVEGYIYYDCKPPLVRHEYYRIKVKGRLTSVAQSSNDYCFIKITSIEGIDIRVSAYGDWEKKGYFMYCEEDERKFLNKEYQIIKREILSKCY